jgi:hypothetical protein
MLHPSPQNKVCVTNDISPDFYRGTTMNRLFLLCLICFSNATWAASEFVSMPFTYLPLTPAELGNAFPLHKIAERSPTVPAGQSMAKIVWEDATEDSEFAVHPQALQGNDLAGKPWQVTLRGLEHCRPARIFHADLDKNGMEDVIVVRDGCGVGLAPPIWLDLITFERTGRPVLLSLSGYFFDGDSDFAALRDLNHDGKADLIDMDWHDGYWSTTVYQIHNGHWQRANGKFASRSYPLYTRFTERPNRKPVTPRQKAALFVRDFSNRTPWLTGTLSAVITSTPNVTPFDLDPSDKRWRKQNPHIAQFTLIPALGQPQNCENAEILTDDTPAGRLIYGNDLPPEQLIDLQQRALAKKMKIRLYGRERGSLCRPQSVWLKE